MRNGRVNEVVNMAAEQLYGAGCHVTGAYEDGINSTPAPVARLEPR